MDRTSRRSEPPDEFGGRALALSVGKTCRSTLLLPKMNISRPGCLVPIFCIAFVLISSISGRAQSDTETRDRDVLEALAQHLLAEPKFDMTGAENEGALIFLHWRTPVPVRLSSLYRVLDNVVDRLVPTVAKRDLCTRNSKSGYYRDLSFSTNIIVGDVYKWGDRAFQISNPRARAWITACLPGFSADGSKAVVYAEVGPPQVKAAALTAVLTKDGEKWTVNWHRMVWML